VTLERLKLFEAELYDAARRVADPAAPLQPGEWCIWCPAVSRCPAMADYVRETARADFLVDELPKPELLGLPVLVKVIERKKAIERWLQAVEDYIRDKLERGETVPGVKVVSGRPRRYWKNESEVEARLKSVGFVPEEIFIEQIRSPAQIETLLGRKEFEEFLGDLVELRAGVVVAPESDPRPAVTQFDVMPDADPGL
jgi:hypothetical protein